MNENKAHILLVEDDESLSNWISDYLNNKGFKVTQCFRGDDAVKTVLALKPEVMILDGMLPGLDGFDVCKAVRRDYHGHIIMLTARDEEIDEVLGLELGADEYLTKPVRARALLTRINRALMKQQQMDEPQSVELLSKLQPSAVLSFNQLHINGMSRSVTQGGQKVKVSSKEFDVLWVLALNAGQVISRDCLVSQLRGFEYDGLDRSIDLRISKLRKKLGDDPRDSVKIKTIWGKGYLFVPDAW
jgi:DNA-binding response OmpR family regulator